MFSQALKHDTEVIQAIKSSKQSIAHKLDISHLNQNAIDSSTSSVYEEQMKSHLSKATFVGHINTDLDSVAGAIGAAAFYGGTAALSEPYDTLNGEITFALSNCNIPPPPHFSSLPNSDTCDVCLVDHTEEKQMVPELRNCPNRSNRIVGVIDHHALAASFQTTRPLYMELRPWGSMCTIVGFLFASRRRALMKNLAVLLLQAILSDTLNLRSVTTTEADKAMVALLYEYAGIGKLASEIDTKIDASLEGAMYEDTEIDTLAKKQFQAKTNWVVSLGPYEMVRGDQKDFSSGVWKFGISVLEVTDMTPVLEIAENILLELRLLKKEKGLVDDGSGKKVLNRQEELDFSFLFIVDVVEEQSALLVCGGRELALAREAFLDNEEINPDGKSVTMTKACEGITAPGSSILPEETCMMLPKGYVSRKAQFVPAIFDAIQGDFSYEEKEPVSLQPVLEDHVAVRRTTQVLDRLTKSKVNYSRTRTNKLRMIMDYDSTRDFIKKENKLDEKLIQVNEEQARYSHGNLYDQDGRIKRVTLCKLKLKQILEEES